MKLIAILLLIALLLPDQARAEDNADLVCSTMAGDEAGVVGEIDSFANNLDAPMSYNDYKESIKQFSGDIELFSKFNCKDRDSSLYIVSFLDLWHAWLLYYGHKGWEDAAELSIQMLTKCSSTYFATRQGAVCSNWQEKAIAWKDALENPTPQP